MAKEGKNIDFPVSCRVCNRRYMLGALVKKADREGTRELTCPKCGTAIGTSQSLGVIHVV